MNPSRKAAMLSARLHRFGKFAVWEFVRYGCQDCREPWGILVLSKPRISRTASVARGRVTGTGERDIHDAFIRPCLQDYDGWTEGRAGGQVKRARERRRRLEFLTTDDECSAMRDAAWMPMSPTKCSAKRALREKLSEEVIGSINICKPERVS